ncbi:MAG TPA: hypothetical protein VEJ67_14460 [Candidatus Cybelea sp.]|nr:hypothetical protein [Candidatus Cybelea sp.]
MGNKDYRDQGNRERGGDRRFPNPWGETPRLISDAGAQARLKIRRGLARHERFDTTINEHNNITRVLVRLTTGVTFAGMGE